MQAWKIGGVVGLLFLGIQARSDDRPTFIPFGEKGAVKLFINRSESTPKCMNCVRFSVWIEGVAGRREESPIDKVLLVVNHSKAKAKGYFKSELFELQTFLPIYRVLGSAAYSEQRIVDLPYSPDSRVGDLEIRVIATQNRCVDRKDPTCADQIVIAEGTATGQEIAQLQPSTPSEMPNPKDDQDKDAH